MTQSTFEEASEGSGSARRRGRGRVPPPLCRARLERSAIAYLERYASSSANLRQVLLRKARRSAEHHGSEPGEAEALVDEVVAELGRRGLVDDRAFARSLSGRLRRRGSSTRRIRATLIGRGVPEELANEALRADVGAEEDLVAACRYARRRRLGPYRQADGESGEDTHAPGRSAAPRGEDRRERDLAALARAGFPFEVAERVGGASSAADLDEIISREDRPR